MNTRFANTFLALCMLCMLCLAAAAQAHHSTANFDRNQQVTITGTVTSE